MHNDRGSLNALYSDNRLKLGVFGANVSNGCAATTAPGHLEMNWPNGRDVVTLADLAGFEAVVPVPAGKASAVKRTSTAPALRPWRGRPAWVL
jgi:hypothetical protein